MDYARKTVDFIRALSRAEMVFYLLPALMVLLVIGTVAQAEMGLYAAHQKYFASFVLWAPVFSIPVPLPSGYTLLGLLSLNLLLKFLFHSEWSLRKAGIILSHLGALVLLIGGLVTAVSNEERYMPIPEGGASRYLYDYVDRELQIYEDDQLRYNIPFADLQGGLPYGIEVIHRCANCEISVREEEGNFASFARFMALSSKPKGKDPEADIAGLTFTKDGATYIAFEGMPEAIEIGTLKIIFGKAQTILPFEIMLRDFVQQKYPGTRRAEAFHSDIILRDEGTEWPVRIEMNKPLRYKGWTFFQSGFEEAPPNGQGGEITILAVVKNEGWLFPYIGTGVLALGLLLHCFLVLRRGV